MKQQNAAKQVVEVVYKNGTKTYSYIGSGNLRAGQQVSNAPVNHYISGKAYTTPVTVVATHNIEGVNVGDKVGVSNGQVHSIPTGLKFLPGNRELQQDRPVDISGQEMSTSEYMEPFLNRSPAEQRLLAKNITIDNSKAQTRLLGR